MRRTVDLLLLYKVVLTLQFKKHYPLSRGDSRSSHSSHKLAGRHFTAEVGVGNEAAITSLQFLISTVPFTRRGANCPSTRQSALHFPFRTRSEREQSSKSQPTIYIVKSNRTATRVSAAGGIVKFLYPFLKKYSQVAYLTLNSNTWSAVFNSSRSKRTLDLL